jgi:tRNA threonylcarbamoyladenosine biosynthesis protein TsaB
VTSLFIDTSYNQILGLLSNESTWIDSKIYEGQKLTGVIHHDLDVLLKNNSQKLSDVSCVYYCAGPGFYTGLRVAYGIADILRIHLIPVKSFYNFHIPKFCGVKDYIWLTKAYRGEVFVYDSRDSKISLMGEKNFQNTYGNTDFYTHSKTSIDDTIREKFPTIKHTEDLLILSAEHIFPQVHKEEELYYFRPLDEEYKPSL